MGSFRSLDRVRSVISRAAQGLCALAAMLALAATMPAYAELPDGYIELEAIKGDGTAAYIKTDYVPNPLTDRMDMKFRCDTSQSSTFFCARIVTTVSLDAWSLFYLSGNPSRLRFDYSASQTSQNVGLSSMQEFELSVASNVVTFADGTTLVANVPCDPAFIQAGSPLFLFASTSDGAVGNGNFGKQMLYYLKIYRSGALIHDYVPARRSSDGKIGLYDVVGGAFFTNANSSGAFAPYYSLYFVPASDPGGTSSLSGLVNGSTQPSGWSIVSNDSTAVRRKITDYEKFYFWSDYFYQIRTPNNASWASPATAEIIVLPNAKANVLNKSCGTSTTDGSVATLTFNNTTLCEGSLFDLLCNENGVYAYCTQVGGSFDIKENATLKFTSTGRSGNSPCGVARLTATVTGNGTIESKLQNVSPSVTASTKRFNQSISGDLSGFTGNLVVYRYNMTYPGDLIHELVNANSIPADPPDGETAYVIVTNGAVLKVDHDWTSGANRIWDFGNGATPTICVPAGKTVTINGEVRGSVGFRKSGPGTLVLGGGGPLSGTCEVLSGKVRLEGGAVAFRRLFRPRSALSLPSGYAMLDYIDLSGANVNSYVDTGYTPTSGSVGFLYDLYVNELLASSSGHRIMGSSPRGTGNWGGVLMGAWCSDAATYCGQIAMGSPAVNIPLDGGLARYERQRMSLLNGMAESSRGWRDSVLGTVSGFQGNIYLGTIHCESGNMAAGAPQRIYRFKVFEGDALVHDFVPVVCKSDGSLGIYDTLGDKGFRAVADQSCATSGGAYLGSDSEWLEVVRQSGSVYYLR